MVTGCLLLQDIGRTEKWQQNMVNDGTNLSLKWVSPSLGQKEVQNLSSLQVKTLPYGLFNLEGPGGSAEADGFEWTCFSPPKMEVFGPSQQAAVAISGKGSQGEEQRTHQTCCSRPEFTGRTGRGMAIRAQLTEASSAACGHGRATPLLKSGV